MNYEIDQSYIDAMREGQNKPDVYARFYWQEVPNRARSVAEGRPIFDQKPYVLLVPKGQRGEERRLPASEQLQRQFPTEWEAFSRGEEAPAVGTPITELPGLPVSIVAELKAQHIRTIEELANLSDIAIQGLGIGGNSLRQRAQAFLARTAPQVAELMRSIEAMQARVAALEAENAALKAARPRRGRPPNKALGL